MARFEIFVRLHARSASCLHAVRMSVSLIFYLGHLHVQKRDKVRKYVNIMLLPSILYIGCLLNLIKIRGLNIP